jgi:hypothetical protein
MFEASSVEEAELARVEAIALGVHASSDSRRSVCMHADACWHHLAPGDPRNARNRQQLRYLSI